MSSPLTDKERGDQYRNRALILLARNRTLRKKVRAVLDQYHWLVKTKGETMRALVAHVYWRNK